MTALRAAEHAGLQHEFEVAIVRCDVTGHAADIGRRFAQVARAFADGRCALEALRQAQLLKGDAIHSPTSWNSDRLCLLFGGETTVELTGDGVGGRNQEMVLAFLIEAARLGLGESTVDFALLSAGTDGQDGPTDSAGAFADRHAVGTVDQQDAQRCLQNNDSYSFWKAFDNGRCHLLIGHTGTNVMDVQGLLLSRRSADIE
uniref:MOFRL domain-containing protein n=1 Tax=Plectus sambesii TaxID=2011161 RepID=A0A914XQM5_9BILA